MKIRVKNMESSRGTVIANQFVITNNKGQYFQSYNSIIAVRPTTGKTQLDKNYWDYSVTTGRY